ncbi:hypothetical protein A8950_1897 [Dongia mobilis]|uniref:Sulphur transport domain-containing protein n=1 Tax=Dongia mobilis TaxID=578943 RepID=A0A4R6WRD2_9PROT|nr:DUF6691 family protein [Dongia mobilis]TDQ82077.1 hypothetical protein A8950_1897 [Dongia mobilis]
MLRLFSALLAGFALGAGLVLSGMANPQKVLAFLDLAAIASGGWDPSLALVMAGALAVAVPGFAWLRRLEKPALADSFAWPQATRIDRPLIAGSAIFGLGWGLAGICPGPALAILGLDGYQALVFFAAMLGGMALHRLTANRPALRQG